MNKEIIKNYLRKVFEYNTVLIKCDPKRKISNFDFSPRKM